MSNSESEISDSIVVISSLSDEYNEDNESIRVVKLVHLIPELGLTNVVSSLI